MNENKRKQERQSRDDFGVVLLKDGSDDRRFDLTVCDISQGGMGIQTPRAMSPGDTLQFRLDLPGGPILASATVRWVERNTMGFRAGLAFSALGMWAGLRLNRFLKPYKGEAALEQFDQALWVTAFLMVTVLIWQALGFELASPSEILSFYSDFLKQRL